MNKIIIVFDGAHFSTGAMEFIRRLNDMQPLLLTGLFVPGTNYADLWSANAGGMAIPFNYRQEEGDGPAIEKNIQTFEGICRNNAIDYRVHKDLVDFALPELKKECRFADMLVIGSEFFYKETSVQGPNEYLKEVLHHAECPVLLLPESVEFPLTNILAYDGTGSSVFAIKQFAYLFPSLCGNETFVIYAHEDEGDIVPEQEYIGDLVSRHFSKPDFMKLRFDPKKHFEEWALDKKGTILVTGAFGRSGLSRVFHKSFITEMIRDHKLPIFIAHR